MPRSVSAVANLFIDVPPAEGKKLRRKKFKFCEECVAANGTRMEGHVKRCRKLTDEERDVYLRKHCGDIEDVGAPGR